MSHTLYSSVIGSAYAGLPIHDRGLAYGDGVFETLRLVEGAIPLLAYHRARLERGLRVLQFAAIDQCLANFDKALSEALSFVSKEKVKESLVKIIVTREAGSRGYTPSNEASGNVMFEVLPMPKFPETYYKKGVKVGVSDVVLSQQPLLAGVKHLNRLEQVLASQRLGADQEALLCDAKGNVAEGTKSNLLVFTESDVFTPYLEEYGVTGTLRAYLMDQSSQLDFAIQEASIKLEAICTSKVSLALINSVIGCWPVRSFNSEILNIDPRCRDIQVLLSETLHFPPVK